MNFFRKNAAALAVLLLPLSTSALEPARRIKFATLAPEGSTWMRAMRGINAELLKRTDGALGFKIYPGGVAGDDKDVLRKIRIGELEAGGFTGVGLGEIAPEERILDTPWLFKDPSEVDFTREKFGADFNRDFKEGGFVLLGWTDLGFVHFFSQRPISSPSDLREDKVWIWEGDPIAEAAFNVLGVNPIPLSELDVMSSLQTGMIDTVYGPPLAVTALQWFTKTRFIDPVPLAYASGAALISDQVFESLPESQRKTLQAVCASGLKRLSVLTRRENAAALRALQRQGLVLSPMPSKKTIALYAVLGQKTRQALVGRLYSQAFLDRVEKALETRRGNDGRHR